MGKKLRQKNVSGLSRFLQVLDEPVPLSTTTSCATAGTAGSSMPQLKRKPDLVDSEQQPRPGERKTGLLGPGNEAYDATGLVPFYTDAAQVPAHLQKCTYNRELCCTRNIKLTPHAAKNRFCSTHTLLFEVR
jgi:trimethylguanosine synthase